MKRVTLIATALVLAVLVALTTRAMAQETNTQERSFITFSNTVEMPGVTLPGGTYVFRLADTPTRNVVQVLSQDEKKVLGQWLFVQAQRPEPTDDTVIMFKERAENTTPAVQYWYFPGESIGKEFLYPKDQAEKIAARTGQKVRTSEGYVTGEANASNDKGTVQGPGLAGIEQSQSSQSAENTEHNAPASAQPSNQAGSLTGNRGAESTQAENQASSPSLSNNQAAGTSGSNEQYNRPVGTTGEARHLPKTASPLPLSGLIGLLSLIGFVGFRKFAVEN